MEDFTNKYEDTDVSKLIAACRERDDFAFAELVRRYTPMIRGVIFAFSDKAVDFDELLSEACVALHTAAMRYDLEQRDVTFGLYARICVSRRIMDAVRRWERSQGVSPLDVEGLSQESDDAIESRLVERETVELLMKSARNLLSDYEFRVLILHMQGYKTRDIARILGRDSKSVDNAKARLFRRLRSAVDGTI